MRTFVDHSVMFLLDEPGEVCPVSGDLHKFARLSGVMVRFPSGRDPQVSASGIRCRGDGEPDRRMGKVSMPVVLRDPDVWIECARQALRDTDG